jgi:hypothetical protein
MRLSWFSLALFVVIISLMGCAVRKSSKPEEGIEEIELKDAEVDHADQPIQEYESK